MKRIIAFLVLLLMPGHAFANGLTVTQEGDVGIGTSEPAATLHVNGPAIIGSGGRGTRSLNIAEYFSSLNDTNAYIHLKTPFNPAIEADTFHIKVSGYSLHNFSNHLIDLTFTGYSYTACNCVAYTTTLDPTNQYSPAIYKGSDNFIYLRFKPANTYYLTFVVDSIFVGNGRILKPGDIQVVPSSSVTL